MITIDREGNGYRLRFSTPGTGVRGYNTKAMTVEEIQNAVEHYFIGHFREMRDCPLCRLVRKEKKHT